MINKQLNYWLAALHLPIRPHKFMIWLAHFSNIERLFQASREELYAAGIGADHIEALKNPDWQSVEKDLAWATVADHHLLSIEDEYYPRLLKETADPPLLLYVQGNKQALSQLQLAIVGSRKATHTGLNNAERFAYYLADAGLAITSGLALGVDAAGHRGALNAKGITLAVAGTGLEHIYPRSHRFLLDDILNHQGAILSEFPLSTPPQAQNFPRRNRIISGLSIGVLVVEAELKSGSLITARHALEQGREVFAIPGCIHQPRARGCHALIKQGAKLVETVTDILEELSFGFGHLQLRVDQKTDMPAKENKPLELTPLEQRVFEQIEYEMTPIDVIILRSGLTIGEVSSILLALELRQLIQSVQGGYIRDTQVR